MSAGRGRRVRFPAASEIPKPPPNVPRVGPVAFSARFSGGVERRFDLSELPCPRLVRRLAHALSLIAGEENNQTYVETTASYVRAVGLLAAFLAELDPDEAATFGVGDLTPELLEAFEVKVIAAHDEGSRVPYTIVLAVVRLLRLLHDEDAGIFDAAMQARLSFTAVRAAGGRSRRLDAYPGKVFEAMQAAALADVRAIRDRILKGERLARSGQDPWMHGWSVPNALWLIARDGPITSTIRSRRGLPDRLHAIGGVGRLNTRLFLSPHDLVPFLVLLICQTGMEPECVRGLSADCLVNPARGYVSVSYVKNRAHGSSQKTLRVADGGGLQHPGGLIRLALRLTAHGRQVAGSELLWTHVGRQGNVVASFGIHRRTVLELEKRAWMRRHGIDALRDTSGEAVVLDLRRLRKTVKSHRYLRSAGVLDDFAEGHTKRVAAAHYADIDAHRALHEEAVENGLREALQAALAPPVVVTEDGSKQGNDDTGLTPEQVTAALSGANDVWLASCTDFYGSPFAAKRGAACPVAVWGCLECPNAVFTTRHLPSVLSFTAFLHRQRDEMTPVEWKVRHGLAWQRITTGVLPQFTTEQVMTAKAIAEGGDSALSLPSRLLELTQ